MAWAVDEPAAVRRRIHAVMEDALRFRGQRVLPLILQPQWHVRHRQLPSNGSLRGGTNSRRPQALHGRGEFLRWQFPTQLVRWDLRLDPCRASEDWFADLPSRCVAILLRVAQRLRSYLQSQRLSAKNPPCERSLEEAPNAYCKFAGRFTAFLKKIGEPRCGYARTVSSWV